MTQELQKANTITSMLKKYSDQIAIALPKSSAMNADRMARIITTELRLTPKLAECEPTSFFGAIIQAAQLGLEPGLSGQAYFVPFKNNKKNCMEVQMIVGFKGMMELARRSGKIKSISAHCVYENDTFNYQYGTDEYLIHKPALSAKGKLIAVYAVAALRDGGSQFEVLSKDDIDIVKKQSKATSNNSPWVSHYDEMARKTAVRKLCKYLPTSSELQSAITLDEKAGADISQGNGRIFDHDEINANGQKASATEKLADQLVA